MYLIPTLPSYACVITIAYKNPNNKKIEQQKNEGSLVHGINCHDTCHLHKTTKNQEEPGTKSHNAGNSSKARAQ